MKKKIFSQIIMTVLMITIPLSAWAYDDEYATTTSYTRTVGVNIMGNIQLVDTLPVMDMGIGGGIFFDYRFNQRFSFMLEGFFTLQNGKGASAAENTIYFFAIPAATFKVYFLDSLAQIDPYIGVGVGFYGLLEGDDSNNTGGFGVGAQIEVGLEYLVADNLVLGVGGTYRSIGIINSLSGTANASVYMPYTLFGRIAYRF
ncbi:MAG: outer membrane beta-barrel protein [bacterium]|nr:porin family protein [bacterium]